MVSFRPRDIRARLRIESPSVASSWNRTLSRVMVNGTATSLFVSQRTLRLVVGALSMALPSVVAIWGFGLCGCFEIQESISHYYDLRTRDAFVGILFVIAIFMFAYQGYEDDANDDFAGNLVCIFALGVALFPISGASWEQVVHVASALGLFSTLAYFCLVLFTKSGPTRTPKKEKRNRVYVACGWTMVVSILLAGLASWLLDAETIAAIKPVFYLESIAIGAFSISWFTKGGTLWRDDP